MRLILPRILLFILPSIIYFAFFIFAKRTPHARMTTYTMLAVAGLLLVAASFVWLGLSESGNTAGRYVPPGLVNGHVVPGHVEKTPR